MTAEKLEQVLAEISKKLQGRVQAAYVFGSVSTGEYHKDSDIDLILVQNTSVEFLERGRSFSDLFAIYPRLDILVYTPQELAAQLADSEVGFWKSARESLKSIL